MYDVPCLCVGEKGSALGDLIPRLEQMNLASSGRLCGFADAFEVLKSQAGPGLTIIDLGPGSDQGFQLAAEIKFAFPSVHVVMTSSDNSSGIVLRALRAGAEEFLPQPFDVQEVTQALGRVLQKIEIQAAQQQKSGHIVAVFSNKGGAGTTMVATNLAISLAEQEKKSVCLVDLDLQFGSVTGVLNLNASYTIVDVVKNFERIDPLFLDGAMGKHPSGVRILASPSYAEEASRIAAADIEKLLDVLAQEFDFVILDCAKCIDDVSLTALQKSRLILFVMSLDIHSINMAKKALDLLERARIPLEKCRIVVNRYVKNKELTLQSVAQALNTEVFHVLPLDYTVAISALNQGVSLAEAKPNAKIALSVQALAEELNRLVAVPDGQANIDRGSRGWLGRLLPAFN